MKTDFIGPNNAHPAYCPFLNAVLARAQVCIFALVVDSTNTTNNVPTYSFISTGKKPCILIICLQFYSFVALQPCFPLESVSMRRF